jgi:hypothetical protein
MSTTQATSPAIASLTSPSPSKTLSRAYTVLAAYPWSVIAGVYLEAGLTRLSIGRWPTPMQDDPKGLATILTTPLHLLLALLFLGLLLAVPASIVLAVVSWRELKRDWRFRLHLALFAVGLIVLVQFVRLDPGDIWRWFLD